MTTAIILAGGLGTRLRARVHDRPKPMALVDGRPFLAILMDYWQSQGITRFILSVGYLSEQIVEYFGKSYQACTIEYVFEKQPMGTGGGLLMAMKKLSPQEPFLLLNGDTFFQVELARLQKSAQQHQAQIVLSLFESDDTERYAGMKLDNEQRVLAFGEKSHESTALTECQKVNGGVYWFESQQGLVKPVGVEMVDDSASQAVSLEADLFPNWLASGVSVFAEVFQHPFIDMGLPEDYDRLAAFLDSLNI